MNKTNTGKHYGFTQYCYPKDFELSGRKITLVSGNGSCTLNFIDRSFIEYTDESGDTLSQYEALKLDDDTHMVFFGEYITAAVLDFENGHAVISDSHGREYAFCKIQGCTEAGEMPGYTKDMAGTHVRWYFGYERYLENTYNDDSTCKCIWSPRTEKFRNIPAKYIYVKDGVYLCQLDSTSPFRTDIPQGFSKIIMLQDYEHLETVGCIYSPVLNEWRMISGYAMPPAGR